MVLCVQKRVSILFHTGENKDHIRSTFGRAKQRKAEMSRGRSDLGSCVTPVPVFLEQPGRSIYSLHPLTNWVTLYLQDDDTFGRHYRPWAS